MSSESQASTSGQPQRKPYVPAVGPRLKVLLFVVFGLLAILGANSAYLGSITFLEWLTGKVYQNYFYQYMFLGHLVVGLLFILPFLAFAVLHMKRAVKRPNRRAVRVGFSLLGVSLLLLISGVALMRLGFFEIKHPGIRSAAYWAHLITPFIAVWLYILHRLAGPKIKWGIGLQWLGAVAVIVVAMVYLHAQDPRKWNVAGPEEGEKYFEPSLARTASGNFIPADKLMMDQYCLDCHEDIHRQWKKSVHHLSSFNNKPYLFSVTETREVALKRDGNVKAARWCAGCHDPVPFFSGAFDKPDYDMQNHPTAHAGISCTVCHSITHINSTKGNADYTIQEPIHYPFAFSTNQFLKFVNKQLVKAKPDFHKKMFLKPLHKTSEFCSTCHKVHIPFELNHYKEFLRGQNHYDSFLLSGVSGHGARSFYYPQKAADRCASCHMPLKPSDDFGADFFKNADQLNVHSHLFPAANTGIAHLEGNEETVKKHQNFLKGALRVDLFGLHQGGKISSPLTAPIRPEVPTLRPNQRYLLDVVIRNLKTGHLFTQGTADSNQPWLDITVKSGDKVIGRSGGLGKYNRVDEWAHFINIYMLDRHGNRIDRRNVQDIFVPLYNHQLPPGTGQLVQYGFTVPEGLSEPITVEIKLQYRKFDTTYMQHVYGEDYTNNLPITTIATDEVTFPVAGLKKAPENPDSPIPDWQRWNDYGIGLLLQGSQGSNKGQLRQAAHAFKQVEKLGQPDGPLNLARVYFKEGRLEDAVKALDRAANFDPPAPRWTVAWLTGLVNKQNGYLDKAIREFRSILEDRYPELKRRGFDFSKDYVVINELGQTYFERAKMARKQEARERFLRLAVKQFQKTLDIDSENVTAHYNLSLVYDRMGRSKKAAHHRKLHARYKPDDNARDRAIAIHRRKDAAADHAAQAITIYPLQRPGAPELDPRYARDTDLMTDAN